MTLNTQVADAVSSTNLPAFAVKVTSPLGRIPQRLRDRRFWQVQALVLLATGVHYGVEIAGFTSPEGAFHGFAINLYILPLLYAALSFGWEGALMTALWGAALTSPSTWIWHHSALHWLAELAELVVTMSIGIIVAWRVDVESRLRRLAEELASRITLLNGRLTNAQEEEWRRIARELHDDTAQNLIILCQALDRAAAARRLPKASREELSNIRSQAQVILASVRRFSRDLRPSVLDDLGLVPAVNWLASELGKQEGIEVSVKAPASLPEMSKEAQIGLFRIVQEALRNVAKHAHATHVAIGITTEKGQLRIEIDDDGVGFHPPPRLSEFIINGKMGLLGMEERAQLLGGSLRIQSRPGGGSRLVVRLAP